MSAVVSLVPPQRSAVVGFLDIPGCQFTRTGLIIDRGMSFPHYQRLGEILNTIEGSIQFWIGDWVRYGEHEYGEKYAQAIDATGYKEKTLRNLVFVAENVPLSRRRDKLSFGHHAEVAALSPSQQSHWLTKAETDNLTVRELRQGIELTKTVRASKKERQELKEHIELAMARIRELKAACPDHTFIRRHYDEWLSDLEFELTERGVIDDQEKLLDAWEQGYRTDEALKKFTGIPRATIIQILGSRLGWEKVREGGKPDGAKGDRRWIWRKPGEALGSDARIPRTATEDEQDY